VQSGLQQHLSGLVAVQSVTVENVDASLEVTVRYTVLEDGSTAETTFTTGARA
jgi:hypothetical protein